MKGFTLWAVRQIFNILDIDIRRQDYSIAQLSGTSVITNISCTIIVLNMNALSQKWKLISPYESQSGLSTGDFKFDSKVIFVFHEFCWNLHTIDNRCVKNRKRSIGYRLYYRFRVNLTFDSNVILVIWNLSCHLYTICIHCAKDEHLH